MFNFLKKLFGRKPTAPSLTSYSDGSTIHYPSAQRALDRQVGWPPVPSPTAIRAEQSARKRREDEMALRRMERGPHTPVPRGNNMAIPPMQSIGRGTRSSDDRRETIGRVPTPYDDIMEPLNPSNLLSPFNPINHVVYTPSPEPAPPDYSCPAPSPSYDPPACSPPPMDFGSSSGTDSSGW